jgi:predicted outer membrane repeat protein/parallel beta-helix repeat protein
VAGYPGVDLTGAVLDGFTIIYYGAPDLPARGAAMHFDLPHEKMTISNNVISNCVGTAKSGGIYIADGASPTIINNVFYGNTVTNWPGGGAIYVHNAAPIISGNTFIGNSAKNGGAIAVDGITYTATIINNTFIGNIAEISGGAVYIENASPSISGNRIYSNTAAVGGGIRVTTGSLADIEDNEIAYNRALGTDGKGGGVFVGDWSNPTLDRNIIRYNSATEGGGVYVENGSAELTNNVLVGNHPAQIWLRYASPSIVNNTIVGTQSSNSVGIDLVGSAQPSIVNNIVAFHAYGIRGDGTALPTIRYNDLWMNWVAHYSGVTTESNNLSVTPGLRDVANGDYHLQSTSALIDAGTMDDAPSHDFEGDVRPIDGSGDGIAAPDIGADEYSAAPPARTRTPTPVSSSPTPTPIGMHTPTSTPTAGSDPLLRQEAEHGTIEPPMTIGSDQNASNGQYVYALWSYEGHVDLDFFTTIEGAYEVWGRVSADSTGTDSFWVTVDGGAEATWDLPLGGWTWVPVTNRESADVSLLQVYHLVSGWHQVLVHTREAGAKLDVLELHNARVAPTPSPTLAQPSATPTPTGTPASTATRTPTETPSRFIIYLPILNR